VTSAVNQPTDSQVYDIHADPFDWNRVFAFATLYDDIPELDAQIAAIPAIPDMTSVFRYSGGLALPANLRSPLTTRACCRSWLATDVVPRPGEPSPFDTVHVPTAKQVLLEASKSGDKRLVYRAALGLGLLYETRAIGLLKATAKTNQSEWSTVARSDGWYDPEAVLDTLARMRNRAALAWLVAISRSEGSPKPSTYWRARAYRARLASEFNEKTIEEALAFGNSVIDGAAKDTAGLDEVIALLYDLPRDVGRGALAARKDAPYLHGIDDPRLHGMVPGAKSSVIPEVITSGKTLVTDGIVPLLSRERSPDSEKMLLKGLDSPLTNYRRISILVLATWKREEAAKTVKEELQRFNDDGRIIACVASTYFGPYVQKDIESVASDPRWPVRRACAIALGRMEPHASKAVLDRLAKDPVEDVALAAKAALKHKMPKLRALVDRYWLVAERCGR